jgi:hypothetical protein
MPGCYFDCRSGTLRLTGIDMIPCQCVVVKETTYSANSEAVSKFTSRNRVQQISVAMHLNSL